MPTDLREASGSNMIFLSIHFFLKFNSNSLIKLLTKINVNFDFEFCPEARLPSANVTKLHPRTECIHKNNNKSLRFQISEYFAAYANLEKFA